MILVASLLLALQGHNVPPTLCPVTFEPAVDSAKAVDWSGIRFTFCCGSCDATFAANPKVALEKAAKADKTIGVFMFDAVSKMSIDPAKAKGGYSDYKGVRYYFENKEEKASFDAEPKNFATLPKKEALYCPINKAKVASYGKASGYADYNGVRYYFCCAGCEKPFAEEPAKFAEIAKGFVSSPAADTHDNKN